MAALAAGLAVIPGNGRLFCDGIPALLVLAGGLAAWAALCRRWPWITLIAALGGFTAYAQWCLAITITVSLTYI